MDDQFLSHPHFEIAPVGMTLLDAAGAIKDANAAFCELLGVGRQELLGQSLAAVAHPDDVSSHATRLLGLLTDCSPHGPFEMRCRRKDGSVQWISVSTCQLDDAPPDGLRFLAVAHDVTAWKTAEALAIERERRLNTIFAAVPACLKVVALDGTIQDMNPAGLEILEAESRDGVIGTSVLSLVESEEREQFVRYTHAIAEGGRGRHEFVGVTMKGRRRWLETTAVPLRDAADRCEALVAVTHDVTARKERELLHTRQTLAMDAALEGMALLDSQARYVYLNRAHVTLFGYDDPGELLGCSWKLFYGAAEVRRIETEILPVLQQEGRWAGEAVARRRDGTTFDEGLSLTLTPDGGLICVCRDISVEKRQRAFLEASLLGQELLLKEVHHRVKNNLQLISSLLQLQAGQTQTREVIEALNESRQRIHSVALVHEALYARPNLGQLELGVYVASLVDHATLVYGLSERGINVEKSLAPLKLPLDAAIPCGLILHELLTNCAKHAFAGARPGTIHVDLLGTTPAGWSLEVRDDGVGSAVDLSDPNRTSLGLRVMRALSTQLDAKLVFTTGQRGTSARLVVGSAQSKRSDHPAAASA